MLEINNIVFYNRYDDDILIIFDSHKITAVDVVNYMCNIHEHLKFKLTCK